LASDHRWIGRTFWRKPLALLWGWRITNSGEFTGNYGDLKLKRARGKSEKLLIGF